MRSHFLSRFIDVYVFWSQNVFSHFRTLGLSVGPLAEGNLQAGAAWGRQESKRLQADEYVGIGSPSEYGKKS